MNELQEYSERIEKAVKIFACSEEMKDIMDGIVYGGEIPERYPESGGLANMALRDIYTKYCSWCLVSSSWIDELAKELRGRRVIEIMAGKGLISHSLQQRGVNIKAYDDFSWRRNIPFTYTEVENKSAMSAIKETDGRLDYVVCSWPPYRKNAMSYAVKVMAQKHPEAKLIYIGENCGGCTADDDFFNMVTTTNGRINRFNPKNFQRFWGLYDDIYEMAVISHKAINYGSPKRKKGGILK